MPAATLTSKGQITIPLAVRTALGLHAGTRVDFVRVDDGFKLVPLRNDASSLKGRFAGACKQTREHRGNGSGHRCRGNAATCA